MSLRPFDTRRALAILAWMALVVGLPSCGGGSDPVVRATPTPVPTPTPPVVVAQGGGPIEAGFIVMAQPIVTNASGALEVTVDWTFAANDIDAIVARGSCSFEQLENDQCTIGGIADSTTAKPERVRVTGATAGTYTLFVVNFGPDDDSASYQAVLFPGASSVDGGPVRRLSLPDKHRPSRGRASW